MPAIRISIAWLTRRTRSTTARGSRMNGRDLHALASRLYPICRSITGAGVRQSLAILRESIPLQVSEVPSGTTVFDWEVPLEWNIDDAAVIGPDGDRVVDFQRHNLHLVSYSEPVATTLALEELQPHLHSLPDRPSWIPYRTSYYSRSWGFCLDHATRQSLRAGHYRVEVQSSLAPGSLTYGECVVPGRIAGRGAVLHARLSSFARQRQHLRHVDRNRARSMGGG